MHHIKIQSFVDFLPVFLCTFMFLLYIRGVENNLLKRLNMKNTRKSDEIENEVFEQLVQNVKAVLAFVVKGRMFGKELKTKWLPAWHIIQILILLCIGYGWFYLVDLINAVRWGDLIPTHFIIHP